MKVTHYVVLSYYSDGSEAPSIAYARGDDAEHLALIILQAHEYSRTVKVFVIDERGMTEVK